METATLSTANSCFIGERRWVSWQVAAGIVPTRWGEVAPTSGMSERLPGWDGGPGARWCRLMDPNWTAEMFLLLRLIIVSATFCHLFLFFVSPSFTFLLFRHRQMSVVAGLFFLYDLLFFLFSPSWFRHSCSIGLSAPSEAASGAALMASRRRSTHAPAASLQIAIALILVPPPLQK